MEEKTTTTARPHKLVLQNRYTAALTGICEVVSFDENIVVLDTDMGLLTIKGRELHVTRLTLEKGEADLEGNIDSLVYTSNDSYRRQGQPLLSRLFR